MFRAPPHPVGDRLRQSGGTQRHRLATLGGAAQERLPLGVTARWSAPRLPLDPLEALPVLDAGRRLQTGADPSAIQQCPSLGPRHTVEAVDQLAGGFASADRRQDDLLRDSPIQVWQREGVGGDVRERIVAGPIGDVDLGIGHRPSPRSSGEVESRCETRTRADISQSLATASAWSRCFLPVKQTTSSFGLFERAVDDGRRGPVAFRNLGAKALHSLDTCGEFGERRWRSSCGHAPRASVSRRSQ